MKAILEFTLPEEYVEFEMALQGKNYKALVEDILNRLKDDIKYNSKKYSRNVLGYSENIRTFIVENMNENGLIID